MRTRPFLPRTPTMPPFPRPRSAPFRASLCLGAALLVSSAAWAQRHVAPDRVPYWWQLSASATELHVPNSGMNLDAPGCASASYLIGSDGVTRDIKLEKVVPRSDLGPTVVEAVKYFRYRPGPENPGAEPIRTWYTAQFNMRNLPAAEKARLTAACALDD